MRLVEDLVFGFGFSPSEIEGWTVRQVHFWHRRAAAYAKRMQPPQQGGRR